MNIGSESKFDELVENIKNAFIKAGKVPETEEEFDEMIKPFVPNDEESEELMTLIESIGEDKCEARFMELVLPAVKALAKE